MARSPETISASSPGRLAKERHPFTYQSGIGSRTACSRQRGKWLAFRKELARIIHDRPGHDPETTENAGRRSQVRINSIEETHRWPKKANQRHTWHVKPPGERSTLGGLRP